MKPLVFYFTFADTDTDKETTFGFAVDNPAPFYKSLGANDYIEAQNAIYDTIASDFEETYGVHDWSSAPADEVDTIGY